MRATSSSLWKGLVNVVVGAEAETPDLVLDAAEAGEDQYGRLHLGDAQRVENLEARHVRQIQVEEILRPSPRPYWPGTLSV
jgi:hypothetical protein